MVRSGMEKSYLNAIIPAFEDLVEQLLDLHVQVEQNGFDYDLRMSRNWLPMLDCYPRIQLQRDPV